MLFGIAVGIVVAAWSPRPVLAQTITKLNGPLPPGAQVNDYAVTPDSSQVIYLADQDVAGKKELYRVPFAGGDITKLTTELPADGDVIDFAISPTGESVVYLADQDDDEVFELYSIPVAGGTSQRLNPDPPPNGDVWSFQIAPNGLQVFYLGDLEVDEKQELYRVSIAGGASTKVSGPMADDRDVFDFVVGPDSSTVLYLADQLTPDIAELFKADGSGDPPVRVNGELAGGGQVADGYGFSPNGEWAVYRASGATATLFELYSVNLTNGMVQKLNEPLAGADDGTGSVSTPIVITPDNAYVLYRATQDTKQMYELYRAPIGGGPTVKLNEPLATGGDVWSFALSPDGQHVVYRAEQETNEQVELYRVSINGGDSVLLSGIMIVVGDVGAMAISPDSSRVLYLADQFDNEVNELFLTGITSSDMQPVSGALAAGGDVTGQFGWTPDGARILFLADKEQNEVYELFSILTYSIVQFESAEHQVGEDAGATGPIRVIRSGALDQTSTVEVQLVNGTAQGGATLDGEADFLGVPITLTFAPAQTVATLTAPIHDDGANEPDESFELRLKTRTGAVLGERATAQVTILDRNDPPAVTTPATQTLQVNQPISLTVPHAIQVSDPDAAGSSVQVALTGTHGTLMPATVENLVVEGQGSSQLSLTGSIEAVNRALDGLVFTPEAGYTGAARIEVSVNDLGHHGVGGAGQAAAALPLTVIATPEPPPSELRLFLPRL
ncbi:MAG TPA: Calx-beta domain-containing protein [Caldilineaceae bacterium]|nr:Calx-beta domain-containing protein [Caldilineaceae bacterium]